MKADTAWIRELIANADHSCEKVTSEALKEQWLKDQYDFKIITITKVSFRMKRIFDH